jgi:hypothetical protein
VASKLFYENVNGVSFFCFDHALRQNERTPMPFRSGVSCRLLGPLALVGNLSGDGLVKGQVLN